MKKTDVVCRSGYYRYLITRTWELVNDAGGVTIEGFEEFDFFIMEEDEKWLIFDAISGRTCCPKSGKSISSIRSIATKYLKKVGKDKVVRSIENSVVKHGISPRYAKLLIMMLSRVDNKVVSDEDNPFNNIIVEK